MHSGHTQSQSRVPARACVFYTRVHTHTHAHTGVPRAEEACVCAMSKPSPSSLPQDALHPLDQPSSEESDEGSDVSQSDEEPSWVSWFCSLRGNECVQCLDCGCGLGCLLLVLSGDTSPCSQGKERCCWRWFHGLSLTPASCPLDHSGTPLLAGSSARWTRTTSKTTSTCPA